MHSNNADLIPLILAVREGDLGGEGPALLLSKSFCVSNSSHRTGI
jgi:hypothetical protein